jgi:hypothetical protein
LTSIHHPAITFSGKDSTEIRSRLMTTDNERQVLRSMHRITANCTLILLNNNHNLLLNFSSAKITGQTPTVAKNEEVFPISFGGQFDADVVISANIFE